MFIKIIIKISITILLIQILTSPTRFPYIPPGAGAGAGAGAGGCDWGLFLQIGKTFEKEAKISYIKLSIIDYWFQFLKVGS